MRDLNLEACLWYLFTSSEFFEAAALECEAIVEWEIEFSAKQNFSPNAENIQIFNKKAIEFRRGAELASCGNYQAIWEVSYWFYSEVRSMVERSPDNWWMTEEQKWIFCAEGRLTRLERFAKCIKCALTNAITAADGFLNPNPEYPERSDDDDGYPGNSIVESYEYLLRYYDEPIYPRLVAPVPECIIDHSVGCETGEEVPWTGVWYPETGLEAHSLTFAIKGLRMQPVFRITKTVEERERENPNCYFGQPATIAVATKWHPVIPSSRTVYAKARERPKADVTRPALTPRLWLPTEPSVEQIQEKNKKTTRPGMPFGLAVWHWLTKL